MSKIFNIDYLLIFLVLSFISIFTFVGDLNYFFPAKKEFYFKTFVNINDVVKYPKSFKLKPSDKILIQDPSFEVFYSLNGGETYDLYENQNLIKLESSNIQNITTSFKHKKPFGKQPTIVSVLIKAENKLKNVITKPILLTYLTNYKSELPIISLVINESGLFDTKKGIMILGEKSWNNNAFYKPIWFKNTNYGQRGDEWLKKVQFQYIQNDSLLYNSICGIQISGHASRSFSQKSLKLKMDKRYGNSPFNYNFFNSNKVKSYTSLVLRNSGNDNKKTMFADLLMHNLIMDLNILSQRGKAVNVFINGKYWGIYNLREPRDRAYISEKEKVKIKKITVLKGYNGELKYGKEKVKLEYIKLVDSFYNKTITSSEDLIVIKQSISLKSFMDYIVIETFYGNDDWLHNNTIWYKAGKKKWKWMINDLDIALSYNNNNIGSNYYKKLLNNKDLTSKLFQVCIRDNSFKKTFKERARYIIKSTFNDQKIKEEFNFVKSAIKADINWQINRWRENYTKNEWEENCTNNLNFLYNRKQLYLKQIDKL